MGRDEVRDGVPLTNLDQPLFEGAGADKRDLVDYLDAVCELLIGELRDRPLSVIRVLRGQAPFMQKNLPKYTPEWVATVPVWAEASKREVTYALCNDRRTLLWFANQRAVEYHPTLALAGQMDHPTYLILDIDPPEGGPFGAAVRAALLVREALAGAGLAGAVKTSGAKGVHVFVPVAHRVTSEEVAAATRAIAARAERLDPALATTAFVKEDREGKVFLDSTRAGGRDRGGRLQPAGAAGHAGVVSGAVGRARPGGARRLHRAHRAAAAGGKCPLGGADARPAVARPPPDRGGPGDPDSPGPGHARRQAPRPRPPHPRRVTSSPLRTTP